jgi:hypothetical protein
MSISQNDLKICKMSIKHTPAPWTYSSKIMTGEIAITACEGKDLKHVATIPMLTTYAATGEEYTANVKLIASAPELLESLIVMLKYCDIERYPLAVQQALAAINKATQ